MYHFFFSSVHYLLHDLRRGEVTEVKSKQIAKSASLALQRAVYVHWT